MRALSFVAISMVAGAAALSPPAVASARGPSAPFGWLISPSPSPRGGGGFSDIALAGQQVWAVGTSAGQRAFSEFLGQDGWELIHVPQPRSASGSALSDVAATGPDDVWAVGWADRGTYQTTLAEHWDGAAWHISSTRNPGGSAYANTFSGVAAIATNDVWAVGVNQSALPRSTLERSPYPPAIPEPVIEHWNGQSWGVVSGDGSLRSGRLSSVSGAASDDVWAVGNQYASGGVGTLIEHWDGSKWSIVSSPNKGTDATLESVAAISADDVWAVGTSYAQTAAGAQNRSLIEHWDGSTWAVVPAAKAGSADWLADVQGTPRGGVWAAGAYVGSKNHTATLVEQWTGSEWQVSPPLNPGPNVNELNGILTTGPLVWAVGRFEATSGRLRTLVERLCLPCDAGA